MSFGRIWNHGNKTWDMGQIRKTTGKMLIVILALTLLSFSLTSSSRQVALNDLEEKLETHYRRYPQQKVYLHLDKLAYRAGETIWYKAYLLDARSHQPDSISKNLVVELVNSFGQSSMIQLARLEGGLCHGDFLLPDSLPQGLYRLRGYTNWMRNFSEEYFFSREINIWNPEHETSLYRDDRLVNKKFKKKSQKKSWNLDVQFFPEGGDLVNGLNSRIGFKCINELGLGVDIEGEIMDKNKRVITAFHSTHLGMGVFDMTPEAGMKYTAVIKDENKKTMRFRLPQALEKGYVMRIEDQDETSARIQIRGIRPDESFFLACHVRGNLTHSGEYTLENGENTIQLPLSDVPGGIMHITLFDTHWEPRCERLIFIPSEDILNLVISHDKTDYETREQVKLVLTARDAEEKPVEGEFSIAIADRDLENYATEFQSGMIPSFLLTSDLSGRVENPEFYFRQNDPATREALDVLLMTQGWRRFAWKNVINEDLLEIAYPIQRGLAVSGSITKELFNAPLKNLPVTLTVLSEFNDRFIGRTDDKGRYFFLIPDYEDTIKVEITARRLNGRKNLVIYIDDNDLPETRAFYSSYSRDMVVQGTNQFKPQKVEEVDSMQSRTEGLYTEPDYVLMVDDNMRSYSSVLDMISGRIPGVNVSGKNVNIRGASSFMLSTEPLFLLDNVPVDKSTIQALSPNDVERVEVLKGPSAAIYGVRGANGVIAVFTRRGRFLIKGQLIFDMLGYHKPREFYSPKYGSGFDHLIEDNRSCLYWNPKVKTDNEGNADISFYNSEKPGKYFIVVEGITRSGQLGSTERSYTVR